MIVCRKILLAGCFALLMTSLAGEAATVIRWDQGTLTLVRRGGVYGRMIRLDNGEILCGYSVARKLCVCHSRDNGKTWGHEAVVLAPRVGGATNTELLRLQNGWVMIAYNERPGDQVHPYAIGIRISKDNGRTWSPPQTLYQADVLFENGCWEPAMIQLPDGEVQLFFANENPYRNTNEQEITLLRSHDNGQTWTSPETVSIRKGHRDGMPVPLVLTGGKGVAVAIEDNGLNGRFKPVIIHSSLADNWRLPPADGQSPRRWSALVSPLPGKVYAGAPYLRQLPNGETILSCQSTEGGRKEAQMVVYVGDDNARNFAQRSVPFRLPGNAKGLWNSLFVKDANTVTAISSAIIGGIAGVWAIDGKVIRDK